MDVLYAERFRGAQLSHKGTFYSSLICHVQQGCRLLHCFDDAEGAAFSWPGCVSTLYTGTATQSSTRYALHNLGSAKPCIVCGLPSMASLAVHMSGDGALRCRSRGGSRADAVTAIERCPNAQMGPSRHPDVEAFITSMCTQVRHHLLLSKKAMCRGCR